VTQCEGHSAATGNVLPSGDDLAIPLSSQSYTTPEFMKPQNCHEWKHPHVIIKDFTALVDNTQDATHRVIIFRLMFEFINHMCRNKMYVFDKQLHPMQLCIYHGNQVQVVYVEGERISRMARLTGRQSKRGEE